MKLAEATIIKTLTAMLVGVGIGFGMAYWQRIEGEGIGSGLTVDLTVDDRAPFERRLRDLETSLALERDERQALAHELENLRGSMAGRPARGFDEVSQGDTRERPATATDGDRNSLLADRIREPFPDAMPGSSEALDQFLRQQQIDRFVAAGIAPERAQAILRREEEIEMETLRARHAAADAGATSRELENITPLALLRREIGDAEYGKYLEARGRASSIHVREVLRSSPGEFAGLKAGDEIVAYNGQRVFDMNELTALTHQATSGTTVPLQVIRDSQSIEIYIEVGPIGISGGGSSRL